MKNRRKKNSLMLLLILLLAVSIGYAILSTTLKINGSSGIKKSTWNIHWENIANEKGVTATNPAEITDDTTVEYEVSLAKPGDYYEFTVDAKNDGTLDAMISSIESTVNDAAISTLPSYISYSVKYADGSDILINHKLGAGAKETYKVRVEFLRTITEEQLLAIDDEGETYVFDFSVNYLQANDDAITRMAMLQPGSDVNNTMNDLAGGLDNITSVQNASSAQFNDAQGNLTDDNITSMSSGNVEGMASTKDYSRSIKRLGDLNEDVTVEKLEAATSSTTVELSAVYMWFDNGVLYYYSPADVIYLNPNSAYLFSGLSNVTSIDLSKFNTSKVTSMEYMFQDCAEMTTIDLTKFDTSRVTKMQGMFKGYAFGNAASDSKLNLSSFDTSKVTDMSYMFEETGVKTINLSSFNTNKVTNMYAMFRNNSTLKTIYASSKFVVKANSSFESMFVGCTNLTGQNGQQYDDIYDDSYEDYKYAKIDTDGNPGYFTSSNVFLLQPATN